MSQVKQLTSEERELAREVMLEIQQGCQKIIKACRELKFDPFADVVEFHRKFGINYEGGPRELPLGLRGFRKERLLREVDEFEDAWSSGDQADEFDALIDIIYIALGAIHLHGWDFYEGWRRVQAANMAKERASDENKARFVGTHDDGKPADIIKPPGWEPPTFHDLVSDSEEVR